MPLNRSPLLRSPILVSILIFRDMTEQTRNKFDIKRFFSITKSYEKLPNEDLSEDEVENGSSEDKNATSSNATRSQVCAPLAILILLAVSLTAVLWAWPTIKTLTSTFGVTIDRCSNGKIPTMSREWRTLTQREQFNYLAAIQCLRNSPSHFFLDRRDISRYMDFAYAHYENLFGMHHAAGFLPWHRWLLAVFEQSLRDECEYQGSMPYWDWSLDWNGPGRSPVFDETFGFGGDGNPMRESTTLNGSCVTTGPFANMMIPKFPEASPGEGHCLSREFGWKHGADGDKLRKDFLRGVLQEATFWNFTRAFERGPHDTIHWYIGGVLPTVYSPAGESSHKFRHVECVS